MLLAVHDLDISLAMLASIRGSVGLVARAVGQHVQLVSNASVCHFHVMLTLELHVDVRTHVIAC